MWVTRTAVTAILLVLSAEVPAASNADLEARIKQLERKLDSRSLVDMHEQVTALQREVQQLRGDIEVQTHTLESLQKRQRDLYLDIDRRLHRMEAGGIETQSGLAGTAAGASGVVSGTAPAGVAGAKTAEPPKAVAALNPAEQRKAYDEALELLKEGRYADASAAFQSFLTTYPGSSYADNAQYWLGEVYYVTRKFKQALAEFDKVLKKYPESTKTADARLKMGYIYYEQSNWAEARTTLGQVVKDSPGSTSARLAQERIDRMQKEGH
jgi:tol-pal system protein YbgF